jgi:2-oxoglutarate ferredoxin oxidoreductase subunit beta
MTKMKDLTTPCPPNWCAGCGNISIWGAFKQAAVKEGWDNTNTTLVAGIGCHGHIVNFTKLTSFEGLHGRPIPVATGAKMANHDLNVFVFSGDGDCTGEGGNHLIHAARRNHDITVLLHDNTLYALTTGQTSPMTPHDMKTKSTPQGNPDSPFNILALAISAGATFVARAYAGDIPQLRDLIIEANNHKGFAIIDILQPCVTFNKVNTHEMYRENIYYLGDNYDPADKQAAFEKTFEFGDKKIPVGVFYKEEKGSYEQDIPQLDDRTLVKSDPVRKDLEDLFKHYT